jgi:hypothetical protein
LYNVGDDPVLFVAMVTFGRGTVVRAPCSPENGLTTIIISKEGEKVLCTLIRLPLLSAAQLTPLYSMAADIATLYQKGDVYLVDAVNRLKAV